MKLKRAIFIDDEPLVIDMMMNILAGNLKTKIDFKVYLDPDDVADLIEQKQITSEDLIVVDRFLFQRDSLEMQLPALFRGLGYQGPLLIFSYIPVAYQDFSYDAYLKKDMDAVDAFTKWLLV